MKLQHRHQREHYEEMLRRVQEAEPQAYEFDVHPEGEEPLVLKNGVVVLPGHYYSGTLGIAVPPDDVGGQGVWEEV